MMIASRVMRIALVLSLLVLLLGAGGILWLRASPYWAGVTLFSEGKRVENFQAMDTVFPFRDVEAGASVWTLRTQPRPLPQSYVFKGEDRALSAFLERTETAGLLVLHNGAIAHETYRLGATESTRFTSWSVAKSVLSALVGIALDEGYFNGLDDRLDHYVPALTGSGYEGVTLEHALTMSSGIRFDENYDDPFSDVNQLFINLATGTGMVEALAELTRERPPGTYNNYVSADSIAIGLALEAATGMPLERYLETRLWGPMGAEDDAFWNTGRAGQVLPFCCLNARLRDYARFGQLYLSSDARGTEQIVPRGWVAASTQPGAPHLQPGHHAGSSWTFGYGYHWWVPEVPRDDFLAIGIWGQYVYVDRANRVVIVKMSADPGFDTRDHETVAVFRAISDGLGRVD